MRKSYKTTQKKIHILQKYAIKFNILKFSSNKKMGSFAYELSIKFKSEQEC
jgi:hypothetical protein